MQESKHSVGIVRVRECEEEWEWELEWERRQEEGRSAKKNLVEWQKMARNLSNRARDLGKAGDGEARKKTGSDQTWRCTHGQNVP